MDRGADREADPSAEGGPLISSQTPRKKGPAEISGYEPLCTELCTIFHFTFYLSLIYDHPMKEWTSAEIEGFRKVHGLTRKALGELLGVTVQGIYQWERGLRSPGKTAKLLLDRVAREISDGKGVKKR